MRHAPRSLVMLALLALAGGAAACGGDAGLRTELAALRAGQDSLRREVAAMRAALEGRPPQPDPPAEMSYEGGHAYGRPDAPLVIVEFSDYECPFCGQHYRQTFPALMERYVASGQVLYVVRDFPIPQLHPNAVGASFAAQCAAAEDRFWEMHDRLFRHQDALTLDGLLRHAAAVGLDTVPFRECVTSGRHAPAVQQSLRDGSAAGVQATPTFFIGQRTDGGRLRVAHSLVGAQPLPAFQQVLDGLLAGTGRR